MTTDKILLVTDSEQFSDAIEVLGIYAATSYGANDGKPYFARVHEEDYNRLEEVYPDAGWELQYGDGDAPVAILESAESERVLYFIPIWELGVEYSRKSGNAEVYGCYEDGDGNIVVVDIWQREYIIHT